MPPPRPVLGGTRAAHGPTEDIGASLGLGLFRLGCGALQPRVASAVGDNWQENVLAWCTKHSQLLSTICWVVVRRYTTYLSSSSANAGMCRDAMIPFRSPVLHSICGLNADALCLGYGLSWHLARNSYLRVFGRRSCVWPILAFTMCCQGTP